MISNWADLGKLRRENSDVESRKTILLEAKVAADVAVTQLTPTSRRWSGTPEGTGLLPRFSLTSPVADRRKDPIQESLPDLKNSFDEEFHPDTNSGPQSPAQIEAKLCPVSKEATLHSRTEDVEDAEVETGPLEMDLISEGDDATLEACENEDDSALETAWIAAAEPNTPSPGVDDAKVTTAGFNFDAVRLFFEFLGTENSTRGDHRVDQFINSHQPAVQNQFPSRTDFSHISTLGEGQFGCVSLVKHKSSDKLYAMKKIEKAAVTAHPDKVMFMEERDIMATGTSPWIQQIEFAIQDSENLFLVMEHQLGGDLFQHLQRSGDVLREVDTKFYLAELAEAIAALHAMGYVHRDIKPDNVLIGSDGHIRLTDFGSSAKIDDLKNMSKSAAIAGTPDYIAPEMIMLSPSCRNTVGASKPCSISEECTAAVDWWSYGVVAHEMLFGEMPFSNQVESITFANIISYQNYLIIPDATACPEVSNEARNLIRGLLTHPEHRLTYDRIKNHGFFLNCPLDSVRSMTPPYIPAELNDFEVPEVYTETPRECGTLRTNAGYQQFRDLQFVGFSYKKQECLLAEPSMLNTFLVEECMLQSKVVESTPYLMVDAETSMKPIVVGSSSSIGVQTMATNTSFPATDDLAHPVKLPVGTEDIGINTDNNYAVGYPDSDLSEHINNDSMDRKEQQHRAEVAALRERIKELEAELRRKALGKSASLLSLLFDSGSEDESEDSQDPINSITAVEYECEPIWTPRQSMTEAENHEEAKPFSSNSISEKSEIMPSNSDILKGSTLLDSHILDASETSFRMSSDSFIAPTIKRNLKDKIGTACPNDDETTTLSPTLSMTRTITTNTDIGHAPGSDKAGKRYLFENTSSVHESASAPVQGFFVSKSLDLQSPIETSIYASSRCSRSSIEGKPEKNSGKATQSIGSIKHLIQKWDQVTSESLNKGMVPKRRLLTSPRGSSIEESQPIKATLRIQEQLDTTNLDNIPAWKKAILAARQERVDNEKKAAEADKPEVKFSHLPPWMRDLKIRKEKDIREGK